MQSIKDNFRHILKRKLERYGMVAEIVRKSGVSQPTLHRYMQGLNYPTLDVVDALANGFGCEPMELISETKRITELEQALEIIGRALKITVPK